MKALINDKPVDFKDGETILQVARRNGVFIPTLCAFEPLDHHPGTCRVCLVEADDPSTHKKQIVTSCTTPMQEGMKVWTRTPEVRRMQRMQVAWIFSDHEQDCASCVRHGNCELQDVALYVGLRNNSCSGRFTAKRVVDQSAAGLQRDVNKCIRCARCIDACRKIQGISALTMDGIGTKCGVGIAGANRWIDSSICVECGQCTMVCPTGALGEKDETETATDWLVDQEVTTVVAFAPSVRVTIGDEFGIPPGENTEGLIIAALKLLGADYVCDVNWAADVTIMEEGTEFLKRFTEGGKLPMMTSCCPGWVNYVEKHHPELIPNLSTTRSPQGIFGALAKTWFAKEKGVDPKKLRFISIMPCTAKKGEAARPQLSRDGRPDTDLVLTVREFARLLRRHGIDLRRLEPEKYDSPFMSENTGAGAIFGVTGGVMEAALRTVYHKVTGGSLEWIEYAPARGFQGIKEGTVNLGEAGTVKIAVANGLRNAEKLIRKIEAGEADYQFVEVMACPGGCIDGGGTIRIKNGYLTHARERMEGIYTIDRTRPIRQSHENPDVIRLYDEYLGEPNGELAHHLLHTEYTNRKRKPVPKNVSQIWKLVKLG